MIEGFHDVRDEGTAGGTSLEGRNDADEVITVHKTSLL